MSRPAGPWIVSPGFDLLFFSGPELLAVIVALLITPDAGWVWWAGCCWSSAST